MQQHEIGGGPMIADQAHLRGAAGIVERSRFVPVSGREEWRSFIPALSFVLALVFVGIVCYRAGWDDNASRPRQADLTRSAGMTVREVPCPGPQSPSLILQACYTLVSR